MASGPTSLVPDEDLRWSFQFKDASASDDERELTALQAAVDATYSAPAVLSKETVLLSKPSGAFDAAFFCLVGQYPLNSTQPE